MHKTSKHYKNKKSYNNDQIWIYGKHPVLMALSCKKRKIFQILINQNNQSDLEEEIKKSNLNIDRNLIKITNNSNISTILPNDASHQGFALKTLPLKAKNEDEFINKLNNTDKKDLPNILIMDQLTDPHNIGAIIRSSISFGIENIVITKHNFPKENGTICKSSAGMIELVNIIEAKNINNLLHDLKKIGYWCIGLDGQSNNQIKNIINYDNIALIIGNEGSGIRPLVKKNCDLLVKIPIDKKVESLNASNAATIACYELFANKS